MGTTVSGYDCLSVVVWNATVHQPPTTLRTVERVLEITDTVSTVATDVQSWFKIRFDTCYHTL